MMGHLYTLINRLLNGNSYSDLYSSQTISSPIVSENQFNINKTLPLISQDQIINLPSEAFIRSADAVTSYIILEDVNNTFVKDMAVIYISQENLVISNLTNYTLYYIVYAENNFIKLSKTYGGDPIQVNDPGISQNKHILRLAQPITQIDERSFSTLNRSLPGPTKGSIAYGDIGTDKTSTLYYYDGSAYNLFKLGWCGGSGYYNNNSTFAQKYSGWLHGMGNYKIITTNDEIRIQFDYIEVIEPISMARDIVSGVKTFPVSSYNAIITKSATTGLNSLDTGTIASDTGYWVYLVYNPKTKYYGAVISLSSGVPTLPSDSSTTSSYSMYQRLGWIKTNSEAKFFPSLQINRKFTYFSNPNIISSLTSSVDDTVTVNYLVASNNTSPDYPDLDFLETVDCKLTVYTKTNTTEERKFNIQGSDESPLASAFMGRVTNSFAGKISNSDTNYEYIVNDFPIKVGRTYLLALNHQTSTTATTNLSGRIHGWKFNGTLWD